MNNVEHPTECAGREWSICLPVDDTLRRSKCFFISASFYLLWIQICLQESAYTSSLFVRPPFCSCYIMRLTPLGLPGCNGGGVLRRGGGCALPLPLLHPGSLCLHCHAVCHSQGMETNCLQVSSFSASLPARPHFLILHPSLCSSTYCMSQPVRVCVCVNIFYNCTSAQMFCYKYKLSCVGA